MANINKTIKNIKALKIQGASNICRASIAAWRDYLLGFKTKNVKKYLSEAKNVGARLALARPNEPLTVNAFKYLNQRLRVETRFISSKQKQMVLDIPSLKKLTRQYVQDFSSLLHQNGARISVEGAKLIKSKQNIFTHCHSRTVENIFIQAQSQKKKFHVYNDETRPMFQGRITSQKMAEHKILNTMVVDSAATFIVSDHSGDDIKIHQVFLGFDVILPDGSALNKIGSFGITLTANESNIPVYLCGTILKSVKNKKMKIELRREAEVWPKAPKGLEIINYAFDRIPARFITGYVTEFGILKPGDIGKYLRKYYEWI